MIIISSLYITPVYSGIFFFQGFTCLRKTAAAFWQRPILLLFLFPSKKLLSFSQIRVNWNSLFAQWTFNFIPVLQVNFYQSSKRRRNSWRHYSQISFRNATAIADRTHADNNASEFTDGINHTLNGTTSRENIFDDQNSFAGNKLIISPAKHKLIATFFSVN